MQKLVGNSGSARAWFCAFMLALLLGAGGCQTLAPFNQQNYDAGVQALQDVLAFYDKLEAVPVASRSYGRFNADYAKIENQLIVLSVREHSRALNADSADIADAILERWRQTRGFHKQRGEAKDTAGKSYPDFQLASDRKHLIAMFTNLLAGETAKEGAPAAAGKPDAGGKQP